MAQAKVGFVQQSGENGETVVIYPATIGSAVVVGKKTVTAHVKDLSQRAKQLEDDMKDRTIWK